MVQTHTHKVVMILCCKFALHGSRRSLFVDEVEEEEEGIGKKEKIIRKENGYEGREGV